MIGLERRLEKLETKHAGPTQIRVCFVQDGRYFPAGTDLSGPGLSEEEYCALFPEDENTRVIQVNYIDQNLSERAEESNGYIE